jgi:hypothetical protein
VSLPLAAWSVFIGACGSFLITWAFCMVILL